MSSQTGQRDAPGFGIEAGIIVICVIGALVYYVSPGADGGNQKQNEASQVTGGTLVIQQSSQVYDAMVRFLSDGGYKNAMTLDNHPTTGIFAEFLESGRPPVAHPGVFEHPENAASKWVLNPRLVLDHTDSKDQKDQEWYGLVLPGIKKPLCQKLNAILHKDEVNAEPAVSVYSKEQWIGGRIELAGADSRLARRDGCAAASDGEFVFY
ncbi:MAG: hypothetical protein RIR70_301, partial [Pseudomonadota bacterium]